MQLPQQLVRSLKDIKGFDEALFTEVHQSGEQATSIRINPRKIDSPRGLKFSQSVEAGVPWSENGYYLKERPSFTFDPLFHAGCYYVQEASSMFLEQAITQTIDPSAPLKVLDLCAAPGGKSTHIQSLISGDSLLVSNEVIRARSNILKDNIIKWGCRNVIVTQNDPKDFAAVKGFFDMVVVDAPCSGSGLFRRDEEAVGEWSPHNVALCSQRQQRILADVLPALKTNGILIYSTCSYSVDENETVIDWLVKESGMQNLQLKLKDDWKITTIETPAGNTCYRFWPYKLKGEGFFISVFKKTGEGTVANFKRKKTLENLTANELKLVSKWVNPSIHVLFKFKNTVYAWPEKQVDDFFIMLQNLRVIYSGVETGDLAHNKLIPHHGLALSGLVQQNVPRVQLSLQQAINYLQKKDVEISDSLKGWALAEFEHQALGWMNILPNRVNNYYPKELRILKEFAG